MNRKLDQAPDGLGLLANGSSPRWDVDVDTALDRDEWFMQIAGPQVYVYFQLRDLKAIVGALDYLRSGLQHDAGLGRNDQSRAREELHLGQFGTSSVSLRWDNEEVPRCFLVVGATGRSTLHLSLHLEDIQMLTDALDQVAKDINDSASA